MGFKFVSTSVRSDRSNPVSLSITPEKLAIRNARRSSKLRGSVSSVIQSLENRTLFTFGAGDVVVEQTVHGSTSVTGAITLLDYSATGTLNTPGSVTLPTALNGSNQPITELVNSGTLGFMTLSADGKSLIVPGYAEGTGLATSSSVPRVVASVNNAGAVDTSTYFTSSNPVRGAASIDATGFWVNGSSAGVQYVPFGNPGTAAVQISNTATGNPVNTRATVVYNGQLYADGATGTGTLFGPGTVGTGLPTTGPQQLTVLPNFGANSAGSPNQFVFANPTTIYVADSQASTAPTPGGAEKWTLSGGVWSLAYKANVGTGADSGLLGITITPTGQLFGTTGNTSSNRLVSITDTGSTFTFTTLATATATTQFHGVAPAPVTVTPPPVVTTQPTNKVGFAGNTATFTAASYGNLASTVQWYQSTDNGATYQPISGATSPTLTLTGLTTSMSGYKYEAIFTNSGGSTTSNPATLTVNVAPVLNFDQTAYTVNENVSGGNLVVQVDRVGDSSTAVTVGYNFSGGTAVNGTNYTGAAGTLTFPAGTLAPQFITIPIVQVYPQGGDKTFNIVLGTTTGGGVVGTGTTTVTIHDTAETFSLSTAAYTVNENATGGTAEFTVIRSGDLIDPGSVTYSTSDGTGVAGTNYGSTTGTVSFAANQLYATFAVPITNVAGANGNKTFNVTLTADPAFTGKTLLGTNPSAVETIVDSAPLTNNATSAATSTFTIRTSGNVTSAPTFLPVNGSSTNGTSSFGFQTYGVVEFTPSTTPSLYPTSGSTVSSVSNLTLSLFNTDNTPGDNFNGKVGNFNIYYITDSETTTPSTGLKFITSDVGGLNGVGNPILLGTFSFDDNAGFDVFTPATLPTSAQSALVSALNSGAAIRFAVTPGAPTFAADWQGILAPNSPTLGLTDTLTVNQTQESVSFSGSTTTIAETAGATGVTVTRTGTNLSDTETVTYTVANGTAINGTNYTATSGTLTFGPGVTSQDIPVTAINVNPQNGNKSFTLTLSNPVTSDTLHTVPVLGAFPTTMVIITDTNSVGHSETLTQYSSDLSTIETGGPFASAAGPQTGATLKVTGKSKSFPAYGALDFNNFDYLGTSDVFTPTATVTAINGITLNVFNATSTSGINSLNVYLVPDATSNIDPTVPQTVNPHFFDSTTYPLEGLDTSGTTANSFGVPMLLGSVLFNSASQTTSSIPLALANFNSAAQQTLITDLNTGVKFRIIITPTDANDAANFQGYTYRLSDNVLLAPSLSLDVQEAPVTTGTPTWLGAGSQATYNSSTKVLSVTGPTTIIHNPGTDAPIITGNAAADVVTLVPASSSDKVFSLGGFNLSNGATAAFNTGTSGLIATVATSGPVTITGTSTFDLGGNSLSILGASSSLSTLATAVTSGTITSSLVGASDSSHLHVVGIAQGSASAVSTIDGQAINASDVLIRYTYYGDANLDGFVDGSDYTKIDTAFGTAAAKIWSNGDFNYDTKIDGSDYTLIDNAFNTQGAKVATPATQIASASTAKFSTAIPITAIASSSALPSITDLLASDKKDTLAGIVDSVSN